MRKAYPFLPLAGLLGLAVLAGCGRGGAHPDAKADGPRHALNAGGEPQWSAQVRGDSLTFSTGEAVMFQVKAAFADHGKDGQSWTGQLVQSGRPVQPVKLTAAPKPCQDADTGMTYPFTARVEAPGGPYTGCAAPLGQGLGPRR